MTQTQPVLRHWPGEGRQKFKLQNGLEFDRAYSVYCAVSRLRSDSGWSWTFRIARVSLHNCEVAPLTSQTFVRAIFCCLFNRLSLRISTLDIHHRVLRKNLTLGWELLILECSFHLIRSTVKCFHICWLSLSLSLFSLALPSLSPCLSLFFTLSFSLSVALSLSLSLSPGARACLSWFLAGLPTRQWEPDREFNVCTVGIPDRDGHALLGEEEVRPSWFSGKEHSLSVTESGGQDDETSVEEENFVHKKCSVKSVLYEVYFQIFTKFRLKKKGVL